MYDDEYNEEEVERFGREGGAFLIREGIVNTDSLAEIEAYKKNRIEEEEEIEKTERKSFNIIKIRERSDNIMREYLNDSGFDEIEKLEDLVEEFEEQDLDDDFKKQIKVIPEKLKEKLTECYKTLNEYKSELKEIPELLSAVKLLGRLATGKPGLPDKYPYPSKKVKKSMSWQGVQDLLFGGHIPADDEAIEKSSKKNPFPSISRAIRIKKEGIDEIENEMEQDSFDPYDRMA